MMGAFSGAETVKIFKVVFPQNMLSDINCRDAQALMKYLTKVYPNGAGDDFLDWYSVTLFVKVT